ncbi:MAG: helix-hairpin-helix domain-containing protein [Promethearchaeota archaeon]
MSQLTQLKNIGESTVKKLNEAKIFTIKQLANASIEDLIKVKGIGQKSAKKWIEQARAFISRENGASLLQGKEKISSIKKGPQLISSKTGLSITKINAHELQQIHDTLNNMLSRLQALETKVHAIESRIGRNSFNLTSNYQKVRLENENALETLIIDKLQEILQDDRLGIKKIPLEKLFNSLTREYIIDIKDFSKILLRLHAQNVIQLEPGLLDDGFSIKDNYGNIFKIIRLLD